MRVWKCEKREITYTSLLVPRYATVLEDVSCKYQRSEQFSNCMEYILTV